MWAFPDKSCYGRISGRCLTVYLEDDHLRELENNLNVGGSVIDNKGNIQDITVLIGNDGFSECYLDWLITIGKDGLRKVKDTSYQFSARMENGGEILINITQRNWLAA